MKPALVPPDFLLQAYKREIAGEYFAPMEALFELRRCTHRVNTHLAQWLGRDAVSPGRMQILMLLRAHDGPALQRDLVTWLGVTRASVSELLGTLRRDGLVIGYQDLRHGRRQLVELTAAGRRAATKQLRANVKRLGERFAALSAEEIATLIDILRRL